MRVDISLQIADFKAYCLLPKIFFKSLTCKQVNKGENVLSDAKSRRLIRAMPLYFEKFATSGKLTK